MPQQTLSSIALLLLCSYCCNAINAPEMSLPTGVSGSDPVRIFLLSGQSGCVGAASADFLAADSATYPELQGTISGVWYAGYASPKSTSQFYIAPMVAGEARDGKFGPEVSIGRRLADASGGSPIMILKYCHGGTNVKRQWNPGYPDNCWDRNADTGTASWLENAGVVNLDSKSHLYGNLIYTIRRTVEELESASIPYEFSGFFWTQGSADKKLSTWSEYGIDSARLFNTLRSDINEPNLPIIDTGGATHHHLQTGKVFSASIVDGGNVYVSSIAKASSNPDSTCIVGPSNPCAGDTYVNYDLYNHYGYDPKFREISPELIPEGSTSDIFFWFKDYPNDLHAEYEGKILEGYSLANDYIRQFSEWSLTTEMEENDPAILFPWNTCSSGEGPSASNICWIDERVGSAPVDTSSASAIDINYSCPIGNDGGLVDCFSSMSTVMEEKEGKMKLKNLSVGHKVLTGSGQYKLVYTIDHQDTFTMAEFIQVHTRCNTSANETTLPPLEITKSHMVFIRGSNEPVPAEFINVGDVLESLHDGDCFVNKIVNVERQGVWNPLTEDGTIVVDGIVTSTYSAAFGDIFKNVRRENRGSLVHDMGKTKLPISLQNFMHLLMKPYRTICTRTSLLFCQPSKNQKKIFYSWAGASILEFGLQQNQRIQDVMLKAFFFIFSILSIITSPLTLVLTVIVVVIFYDTCMHNKSSSK